MNGATRKIGKQPYTAELKEWAVTRVNDGLTAGAAATALGLVEHTVRNGGKAAAAGPLNGGGATVGTPEQLELSRRRAANGRLTRAHDILKHATAYVARDTL